MSEHVTYTVVVRKDDDVIAEMLRHTAEGICFLWGEDGVTQCALDKGADPTSWNEPLSEFCEDLYARKGNTAVYDYIREHRPDVPWSDCGECDAETPHHDNACLCCGHSDEHADKEDN